MGKHKKTKHFEQGNIPPENNILSTKISFFETVKNLFLIDQICLMNIGQNIFLDSLQHNELITKLNCIKYVSDCLFNLKALNNSKQIIQKSLWKKYQVMFTIEGKFKFNILTTGFEILRIIPKEEKFQQKSMKVGTFNIIYNFFDALRQPNSIQNQALRSHLKCALPVDIKNIILGPKNLQNTETENGVQEFNKFCFSLKVLGISDKTLCDLFDLLKKFLILGYEQIENSDFYCLIQQIKESLNKVENKQHAKVYLQTSNRVIGTILLMYQVFCDTILNIICETKGNSVSEVQVIEKGELIKNEGKNSFDLSFVEFVNNYVWLALEKPPFAASILTAYDSIFSSNKFYDYAQVSKDIGLSSKTSRIRFPFFQEDIGYNFYDFHLNYFQLNSNSQIQLRDSQNSILQNMNLLEDCQTQTMMSFVYQKVQLFQETGLKILCIPETPPVSTEKIIDPTCFNSCGSEVYINISVINSKDSQKWFKGSAYSNQTVQLLDGNTNTKVQIKRSIKNYNQNPTFEETQLKTQSEIKENSSVNQDYDEQNYQQDKDSE